MPSLAEQQLSVGPSARPGADPVERLEHVWIPVRDGSRLSARIWLPDGAHEHPVPALLEAIPYRKDDLTAPGDAARHGYFAQHGYASVRLDIRGSGDSEGLLQDEYLPQEQDDAVDALAWIAGQPWCTGAVGMFGYSWGGFAALQVAARRPPQLKAIVTVSSTDDRFADDVHYLGGCPLAYYLLSWATTMHLYQTMPPLPTVLGDGWRERWLERLRGTTPMIERWLGHQRRDAFWKQGSVCEDYAAIECPVYAFGGWADGYPNAALRLVEHLRAPCKLLIGPWSHHYANEPLPPGPAIGFLQECVRWWDHWLKGADTGVMDEPPVRFWLQDALQPRVCYDTRPGRWICEPSWPSPNVARQERFLTTTGLSPPAGSGLDRSMPDAGTAPSIGSLDIEGEAVVATPQTTGMLAGDWDPFGNPADLPGDQRPEDGRSVTFTSAALTEPLAILGRPVVVLELRSDQPLAMVAVRLCDVHPDGASALVTRGLLNLAHRNGSEQPERLEPGTPVTVRVPLKAIGQVVPVGHRIRLAVSSTYWPWAWPAPRAATLTLRLGPASRIELPVRSGWQDEPAPPDFAEPEEAPGPEPTTLAFRPGDHELSASLAADRHRVVHRYPEFHVRFPDSGTEVRWLEPDTFTIHGDDPLSARVDCQREVAIRRDDQDVRLEASSTMTAGAEAFHVTTTLQAFEAGAPVFANTWMYEIPRDHC